MGDQGHHRRVAQRAVKQDTRKPEGEIKVTEILGVIGASGAYLHLFRQM